MELSTKRIFYVVLAILAVEYFPLPGGFSLFRVVVAPLCVIGTLLLLSRRYSIGQWAGLAVISMLWLLGTATALHASSTASLATTLGVVLFLVFVYLHLATYRVDRTVVTIVALFSLPHFITLVLFWIGLSNEAYTDLPYRFDGLHRDPNFMCIYVLVSFVAKLVLIRKSGLTVRCLLYLGIAADLAMTMLSVSRGGVLAFGVAVLAWLYLTVNRKSLVVAAPIAAAALFAMPTVLPAALSTSFSPVQQVIYRFTSTNLASSEDNIRLYIWDRAIDSIRESGLIFGYSLDRFVAQFGRFPHNTFIDACLEAGLIGGLLLVAIVLVTSIVMFRPKNRPRGYALLVPMMCVVIWSTTIFLSFYQTKLFWLVLVMAVAYVTRGRTSVEK